MADPRQICFDILGKLKIPDPDSPGDFKTVVYQGTSPQFANYRTGLKKPRQVREYVIQTPSNTSGQLTQRSFMQQAIIDWQAADPTEKARANQIAQARRLPQYQAYLSLRINELITESEDTMWQDAYPVGSIYINNTAADPNVFMGFGTWVAFGSGRVLVGLDSGQAEFDTLDKTGGAKTHTLTTAEIPSHNHTQDAHNHTQDAHTHTQDSHNHTQNSHNHTQNSHNHTQNAHSHPVTLSTYNEIDGAGTGANAGPALASNTSPTTATNIAATATNIAATATNIAATATNQDATATNQNATATNQATGGGGAHNNLQPYIVVNFWLRSA
jgi:microcystin-dependent protein